MKVKNVDKYIYKNEYGEEEADMCTAIRELIEDGRAEGRAETEEKYKDLRIEFEKLQKENEELRSKLAMQN